MNKKIAYVLLCMTAGNVLFTSCGEINTDNDLKSTADTSVSLSADTLGYNGSFNEEIFKKLCRDIVINGKKITVPGKLEDWGKKYNYERLFVNPDHTEACYCIRIEDELIGEVTYRQDEKINDEEIMSTPYIHLILESTVDSDSNCGIGNIFLSDKIQPVFEAFGEPNKKKGNKENCSYMYEINEKNYICFYTHKDEISSISILNE